MIRTLHAYLSRELAKVTFLALVAFTMIMTVFAIIEPLQKQGLVAEQVVALLGYTLPLMVSLTLPIAALFAATIVYGRFSQDNELTACRAGGISTISLLKPALVLGGIVTVVSLVFSSFVTPQMIKMGEKTVRANIRNFVYGRLRTKNYFDEQDFLIHADRVDEENDILHGVVVVLRRKRQNVAILVASQASLRFAERDGDTWVTVDLSDVTAIRTGDPSMAEVHAHQPYSKKLPSLAKEDPAWYEWGKLVEVLKNPTENREIRRFFENIQQELCNDMLAQDLASTIAQGKEYGELKKGEFSYQIRAGTVKRGKEGKVHLGAGQQGGVYQPVEVIEYRNGEPYQVATAKGGRVETDFAEISRSWFVTIELIEDVSVISLTDTGMRPQRRASWIAAEIPLPERLSARSKAIPLVDICRRASELTDDKTILKKISILKDQTIRQLINKIKAEMHMRVAYGVSCFLMVAMGAALGLIFRGGQVISAFALCVVPATLVIVMMIMGKQMVRNRDVPTYLGLAAIWVGVLVLVAANVVIYLSLRRK